jgi:hypothetical protein
VFARLTNTDADAAAFPGHVAALREIVESADSESTLT